MIRVGRVVVGTGGSPGSLPALRYAREVARRFHVPLLAALAWVPPGGDLAERRWPSPHLRHIWADAARQRLREALEAAWGSAPPDLELTLVIIRGEPGPALVETADANDDFLIIGGGRRGTLLVRAPGRPVTCHYASSTRDGPGPVKTRSARATRQVAGQCFSLDACQPHAVAPEAIAE